LNRTLRVLGFLLLLYLFFFCIDLMGGAFKLVGKEVAEGLFVVTSNPIAGLIIGILATSLVQSSSTTTSVIVGMVAAGTLSVTQAVPMVMGANIGTTITNLLVSMGHISRRDEFERAFAGATVHDFFNLCAVTLLLPLEIFFHPIETSAHWLSEHLLGMTAATFHSPLKVIVEPVVKPLIAWGQTVIESRVVLAIALVALAFALLIFALAKMVTVMRGTVAARLETVLDRYVFTSTARAFGVGLLVTAIVQSSSVTTSLVVPMLGAGIVRLEPVYPYMLGANIGTTVTAILASMVTGSPAAVTIAICHLLFNGFGTAVFLPLKALPIAMSRWMGRQVARRRWVAPVYVGVVFFVIPGILLLVT